MKCKFVGKSCQQMSYTFGQLNCIKPNMAIALEYIVFLLSFGNPLSWCQTSIEITNILSSFFVFPADKKRRKKGRHTNVRRFHARLTSALIVHISVVYEFFTEFQFCASLQRVKYAFCEVSRFVSVSIFYCKI